jgi:hypothetical protein
LEEGKLRHIRLGNREIVRQIYVALRDRFWNTPQPFISDLQVTEGNGSFRVNFNARVMANEIDFVWRGVIIGDKEGTIEFSMDGEAFSTFVRGRLGFCVLHPIAECSGQPFTVVTPDGGIAQHIFPALISPHQPAFDISQISYKVLPGLTVEIQCDGDIFEMEDQRNWSDASYKTYCTPLSLPRQVEVPKGTRIEQKITLRLKGQAPTPEPEEHLNIVSVTNEAIGPMLGIGLSLPADLRPLSEREVLRLRAIRLSHLRVDLRLFDSGYEDRLREATAQARALRVPLEVAFFVSDDAEAELANLVSALLEFRPEVCRWMIFHQDEPSTGERWLRLARQHLATYAPQAMLAGGSNQYFTELNRQRPPLEFLDMVCYPVNPQVHTFDNLSMVENLQGQAYQLASARAFCGDKPIAVGPVTLKSRFNPASGRPGLTPEGLSVSIDPRQISLFGAAWTVGSIKYLAEGGAYSATFYQTVGPEGVMEQESGSPNPAAFPSLPGMAFPLYHVIGDAGAFAGGQALRATSSAPLRVEALAMAKGERRRLLLANMTSEAQTVTVSGIGQGARVKWLDERNAIDAMRHPGMCRAQACEELLVPAGELEAELLPYAVARIDWEE